MNVIFQRFRNPPQEVFYLDRTIFVVQKGSFFRCDRFDCVTTDEPYEISQNGFFAFNWKLKKLRPKFLDFFFASPVILGLNRLFAISPK